MLTERNLRGLGAMHRLIGQHAGTVVEFDGAVGSIVDAAPDYPWLNALVCEPGADFKRVLERVVETDDLVQLAVWARDPDQVDTAAEAGFTNLIATVPAMSMELDHVEAGGCTSEPIALAEAGALSDAAYGNKAREVERTLARIPTDRVQARGRRDATGRIVAAALALDVDDDCSIQYVATRPDAQRRGYGLALLSDMLARARNRGVSTTSLQSSEAGARLYQRLGYRKVATLELRCRACGPTRGMTRRVGQFGAWRGLQMVPRAFPPAS